MYADTNKIKWLLFESGLSIAQINKETGVAVSTISDLINKRSSIEQMRLTNAAKLTKFAEKTAIGLSKTIEKYPEDPHK